MSWEDKVYVDNQLPFGLSSAPVIFNAYADGIEWILRKEGVSHVLHYLDDFLVMGHPDCGECQSALSTVMRVCEDLGVPLAEEKLEGPVKSIQFWGLFWTLYEWRFGCQRVNYLLCRSCWRSGRVVSPA